MRIDVPDTDVDHVPHQIRAIEGVVTNTPAGPDDLLHVAIPSLDGEQDYGGGLRWVKRGDGVMPSPGDACLVQTTSTGLPWVLAYWPY